MCGLTTVPTPARYLLLDNNTLNGTIPRNFGQLTALQALSVANNKLVGGIAGLAMVMLIWPLIGAVKSWFQPSDA